MINNTNHRDSTIRHIPDYRPEPLQEGLYQLPPSNLVTFRMRRNLAGGYFGKWSIQAFFSQSCARRQHPSSKPQLQILPRLHFIDLALALHFPSPLQPQFFSKKDGILISRGALLKHENRYGPSTHRLIVGIRKLSTILLEVFFIIVFKTRAVLINLEYLLQI